MGSARREGLLAPADVHFALTTSPRDFWRALAADSAADTGWAPPPQLAGQPVVVGTAASVTERL